MFNFFPGSLVLVSVVLLVTVLAEPNPISANSTKLNQTEDAKKVVRARAFQAVEIAEQSSDPQDDLRTDIIKFCLVAVAITIPLILIPALFLYARVGNGSEEEYNEKDAASENQQNEEKLETVLDEVILLPTMPLEHDPYLADESNWSGHLSAVAMSNESGNPFGYRLQPGVTMYRPLTGQLYHPPSGLLFNRLPLEVTFDPESGCAVHQNNPDKLLSVNSNLVYLAEPGDVHYLYERSLALSFVANEEDDNGNGNGTWRLAPSPVVKSAISGQSFQLPILNSIRRARIEELPAVFAAPYSRLLAQFQQDLDVTGIRPGRSGSLQSNNSLTNKDENEVDKVSPTLHGAFFTPALQGPWEMNETSTMYMETTSRRLEAV